MAENHNPAPAPAPDPAPAPPPAPDPAPAPAPTADWHGIKDEEAVTYIKNKGWEGPEDMLRSYRGAEKLIGRDPSTLIPLPRSDDPEAFRATMQKLGLPESPDKYQFDKPKDLPLGDDYWNWMSEAFHKAGIPASSAKTLVDAHNEKLRADAQAAADDYKLAVESDKKALLSEWRGGFDRMMNRAKTAAASLGFDEKTIDAIEKEVGYAATMKMFADIGAKLGEDNFVSGDDRGRQFSDTMTPDEAKQQWDTMKLDPNFTKALTDPSHPGHKAAKEKQSKLFGLMYPEG